MGERVTAGPPSVRTVTDAVEPPRSSLSRIAEGLDG